MNENGVSESLSKRAPGVKSSYWMSVFEKPWPVITATLPL